MEYLLMHKNDIVVSFNNMKNTVIVLNKELLPFSMRRDKLTFDDILIFCVNRVIPRNRAYRNQILQACGIGSNISDFDLCVEAKALSLRDCYWIKDAYDCSRWEDVNLYDKQLESGVAYTGVSGRVVMAEDAVNLVTGELTLNGTRPKSCISNGRDIVLTKHLSNDEICIEGLSSMLADLVGIESAYYMPANHAGIECSACKLLTSKSVELIPCRDIMIRFRETVSGINTNTFKYFMEEDKEKFIKMFLFDYITLNIDRNRDNYGLLQRDGQIEGLFPLFDHDQCFKGKSVDAIYFPMQLTFKESLEYLIEYEQDIVRTVIKDFVVNFCTAVPNADTIVERVIDDEAYDEFIDRVDYITKLVE